MPTDKAMREDFKENMTDVSALSRKLVEKNKQIADLKAELARMTDQYHEAKSRADQRGAKLDRIRNG